MNYFYSPINNAFYPEALKVNYMKYDSWPDDGIEVDGGVYFEYAGLAPEGKVRAPGENGLPVWVDIPAPTREQLIEQAGSHKSGLLVSAQSAISLWQSELLLGIISDKDKASLTSWIAYIKSVKAIDTSKAPDITWPEMPA